MNHDEPGLITIETAPAGRGVDWLIDGFGIFQKNWLLWIGIQIFFIFLFFTSVFVPFGNFVLQLLFPVFTGGLILGCKLADEGESFTFEHLFSGFSNNFGQLFVIGLVHLFGSLLIGLFCLGVLIVLMGGMAVVMENFQFLFDAAMGNDVETLTELALNLTLLLLLVTLIGLALYLPLLMLIWFAPALVILDDMDAIEALKYSFMGCLKNVVPYLLYGIVGLILSFLVSIPLMLGWFVLTPMIFASIYLAYKDIYIQN